jgi:hypothetical protein
VRAQQAFRRYPALRERFNSVVVNFFKTAMAPTTKLVSDMVAMQACYVNTTHPDFLNGRKVRHFFFLSIFFTLEGHGTRDGSPKCKQTRDTGAQARRKGLLRPTEQQQGP